MEAKKSQKLKPESQFSVGIVGWSGYSGIELAKLVLRHPLMKLTACFSRPSTGSQANLSQFIIGAPNVPVIDIEKLPTVAEEFDAIFFATPVEVSRSLIEPLKDKATLLIDLSGAFRLKDNDGFVYGLQPWQKQKSSLVSNPGCYVTSVLMALIPLLKNQLIDPQSLVIDAKSGTTGAGKEAKTGLLFSEVEGNCLPYKVGTHQHLPEITEYLEKFSGVATSPFFTTHLLPTRRGIISSIYAKTTVNESQIFEAFHEAYNSYSLLKFQALTVGEELLALNNVVGTAHTHISYKVVGDQLYLFSCIDNLLKGAASQAVENWNVLHDLPVSCGLESQWSEV